MNHSFYDGAVCFFLPTSHWPLYSGPLWHIAALADELLSFNLSWGYFPVITFFYIWLSLSLFFTAVIWASPTYMLSCGTATCLPLKSSRIQPFSPSIWPFAREALIQDGSPPPTQPPPPPLPPNRGVMSQWSKMSGWPLLLPNLYFSALAEC